MVLYGLAFPKSTHNEPKIAGVGDCNKRKDTHSRDIWECLERIRRKKSLERKVVW